MTWEVEQIGDCTLYRGDCREILPTLAPVDAVVTDPPYGIGFLSNGRRVSKTRPRLYLTPYVDNKAVHGDRAPFDPTPWLDRAPFCLFWGANYFADKLPPQASWLVWDKRVNPLYYGTQPYADCELAWCNDGKPARMHQQIWSGLVRQGEEASAPRIHPMQKPVALMRWCLARCPQARVILDPYAGSFTTGVAAMQRGQAFIGIEIETAYWERGCRRIEEAYRQPDLFRQPSPVPHPHQEVLLS